MSGERETYLVRGSCFWQGGGSPRTLPLSPPTFPEPRAMSAVPVAPLARSSAWKWWVCGLLLLATMINYMDRLTLNQLSKQIIDHFGKSALEYGWLESAFGSAFAIGAIIFGWMADRWNPRGIYALAVLAWSLAGFATGLAT